MASPIASGGDIAQASITSITSQASSGQLSPASKHSKARSSAKQVSSGTAEISDVSLVSKSSSGSKKSTSKSPTRNISQEIPAKPRRRRKKGLGDDAHRVVFTVTVAQAIPTAVFEGRTTNTDADEGLSRNSAGYADDQPDVNTLVKRKKRIVEAPRAQNYYHCEYFLLPGDDEPVRTDVVTFGLAAKIYPDKHEPKVLKTWQDGDQTWVVWSHSHTIVITDEILLKLYKHDLEFRIWDMKEKCSSRAKFDRPKAFKLPTAKGDDLEDIGGVKSMVLKEAKNFLASQPRKAKIYRPLPSMTHITFDVNGHMILNDLSESQPVNREKPKEKQGEKETEKNNKNEYELIAMQSKDVTAQATDERTFSRLAQLAGVTHPKEPKKETVPKRRGRAATKTDDEDDDDFISPKSAPAPKGGKNKRNSLSSIKKGADEDEDDVPGSAPPGTSSTLGLRRQKKDPLVQAAAEYVRKHGIALIKVRLAALFAGKTTITSRLIQPVPTVDDMFVTVSIDKPIMSAEQRLKLNPIVIKVHSATNMPNTPISQFELEQRCHPVFCKYKFFNEEEHESMGQEHDDNLYWDDVTVFLAGTMDKSELREYLMGPPLTIEVRDRDRKYLEQKLKPTLFGDDLEDEKISNVGTVGSKRTVYNPYLDREKPWDPYGVAKFDLSGLLLGQKMLELQSPIQPCQMPDPLGLQEGKMDGKLLGVKGAVDGPVDVPLLSGHYLQSGASLKIQVEISHVLTTPEDIALNYDADTTVECPFSRIIYRLDYKNTVFLHKIQNLITEINARGLQLDHLPNNVVTVALSTYKLSRQQQRSRDLDIITGFHVMDGRRHVFVLEGLRDIGIRLLWESLPKEENSDVDILYHTDMCFSDRLYMVLDVDLCRVKLHEPLDIIVKQPLLYVRDMVPKPCFQALTKLHDLISMDKLRNAVRNDLFPTAEMVVSMSKEFGVPLTSEDFEDLQLVDDNDGVFRQADNWLTNIGPSNMRTPVDNFNENYVDKLEKRELEGTQKDHMKENKKDVKKQSDVNKVIKEKKKPFILYADVQPAHNYSTQYFNSTELAKEKLRQLLAKDSDRRYTYCQKYHHSMTVVPVNVDKLRKDEANRSQARWQTQNGFTYPGVKSTLDCNSHKKSPAEARTDELKMPWIENTLHRSKMQPTLERDRFTWDCRHEDMNLWRQPTQDPHSISPIKIHEAGVKLEQEKALDTHIKHQDWLSKIVVDTMDVHTHRCLPATELTSKGFKSSNQLDRLRGLLKNEPRKVALRRPGMRLWEVPPLSVVSNPSVDTASRRFGLRLPPAMNSNAEKTKGFIPGPYAERSWLVETNKIPIRDYDHSKFAIEKGHDFNVYHKERDVLSLRPFYHVSPTDSEEIDRHRIVWITDLNNTCPELTDSGIGTHLTTDCGMNSSVFQNNLEKQTIECME